MSALRKKNRPRLLKTVISKRLNLFFLFLFLSLLAYAFFFQIFVEHRQLREMMNDYARDIFFHLDLTLDRIELLASRETDLSLYENFLHSGRKLSDGELILSNDLDSDITPLFCPIGLFSNTGEMKTNHPYFIAPKGIEQAVHEGAYSNKTLIFQSNQYIYLLIPLKYGNTVIGVMAVQSDISELLKEMLENTVRSTDFQYTMKIGDYSQELIISKSPAYFTVSANPDKSLFFAGQIPITIKVGATIINLFEKSAPVLIILLGIFILFFFSGMMLTSVIMSPLTEPIEILARKIRGSGRKENQKDYDFSDFPEEFRQLSDALDEQERALRLYEKERESQYKQELKEIEYLHSLLRKILNREAFEVILESVYSHVDYVINHVGNQFFVDFLNREKVKISASADWYSKELIMSWADNNNLPARGESIKFQAGQSGNEEFYIRPYPIYRGTEISAVYGIESRQNITDENSLRYLNGISDILTLAWQEEQAFNEINRRQFLYYNVFNSTRNGLALLDSKGTVLLHNENLASLLTGSPRDLVGQSILDNISCDDPEKTIESLKDVLSSGTSRGDLEFHKKSKYFSIWINYIPVQNGMDFYALECIDITEDRMTNTNLTLYHEVFKNSVFSVVITNERGEILLFNKAFLDRTGYDAHEVLGQNPRILKTDFHTTDFYRNLWETISRGDSWINEICNKRKDGTVFWEKAHIFPVTIPHTGRKYYVAIKEDISHEKESEAMKEDIDRIMRHDLKTPLNGIIGLPQVILMDENLDENQKLILKNIETAGRNMLQQINLSLDMYRIEKGEYEYHSGSTDLVPIIKQVASELSSLMNARKCEVSLVINDELQNRETESSFVTEGDKRFFYPIFSNLIKNAVEASPQGAKVSITLEETEKRILIAITNQGVVPERIRKVFFEKYVTYNKNKGTGLGTYSAKLLSEAMGYSIEMETSDIQEKTSLILYRDKAADNE